MILVTGGTGYIGSHTVIELLLKGHEVLIIDNLSRSSQKVLDLIKKVTNRKELLFEKVDLKDVKALENVFKEYSIKSVIHFAAYKAVGESMQNSLDYYNNNVCSLINLLSCMEKYKVNELIFSSSCTVYGNTKELPVTINSYSKESNSVYGRTKIMAETIIEDTINYSSFNLKAVILRYFNPVGAHPSGLIGEIPFGEPNNLFPYITQTILKKRSFLRIFGNDYNTHDGTAIRDYIHVVDVANAHLKSIEYINRMNESVDIFNLSTGKGYSVLDVVKMFEKVINGSFNYQFFDRRTGDVEAIWSDSERANKILDWKAKYNLRDMVVSSLNWEKNIID